MWFDRRSVGIEVSEYDRAYVYLDHVVWRQLPNFIATVPSCYGNLTLQTAQMSIFDPGPWVDIGEDSKLVIYAREETFVHKLLHSTPYSILIQGLNMATYPGSHTAK